MKTEFTLIADKFTKDAADQTPEYTAKYCKWYEDMLTLNHPKFKDLTATTQRDFYKTGVVKSVGWQYIAEDPVRVFVCEDGDWRIRYVPTKKLAKQYIKKFSGPGPIFWFFYDIDKVNMIEA
jgi:hypothetical protein